MFRIFEKTEKKRSRQVLQDTTRRAIEELDSVAKNLQKVMQKTGEKIKAQTMG